MPTFECVRIVSKRDWHQVTIATPHSVHTMHLPPGAACRVLRLNHQPGFLGHARLHSVAAAVSSILIHERRKADKLVYLRPDL
jgi:hypothetical protein